MEQIIVTKRSGESYPLVVRSKAIVLKDAWQNWGLLSDDVVNITIESPYPQLHEIGDHIIVFGRAYKLNRLPSLRKTGAYSYTYTLVFEGVQYDLLSVFYDLSIETTGNTLQDVQGDALTGDLKRFATVLISNANRVYPGKWKLGTCPKTIEDKNLTFGDSDNCLAVMHKLCSEFGVEVDIDQDGEVYTMTFVEKVGKTYPITFEFGRGKGLYALDRQNVDSSNVVTRLKVYGSSDNITHKYRASKLCLPGKSKGKSYIENVDAVKRYGTHEACKVFSDIKPKFDGVVTEVFVDNVLKFSDANMFDLLEKDANGTKYLLSGTPAKIRFNTGNLAGYEFEVSDYDHGSHTFTIKRLTDDRGDVFPSDTQTAFRISEGDKYKILDITLPERYVSEAEEELKRQAEKYYEQNCQPKVKYGLSITKSFIEKSVSDGTFTTFKPGDYLPIKDEAIGVDKAVRIQSLRRNVLDEYDYNLTISDAVETNLATRIISDLIEKGKTEEQNKSELKRQIRQLGDRTYQDAEQTKALIEKLELKQFTESISPRTISTVQAIFGIPECQFVFVKSKSDTTRLPFRYEFRANGTELFIPSQFIAKEKAGTSLTTKRQFEVFAIPELTYSLKDDESNLHLYAIIDATGNKFSVYKEPLPTSKENNLIGLITGIGKDRQLTTLYGFTEITPGQMRTDRVVSANGSVVFDLAGNALHIGSTDGKSYLDYNTLGDGKVRIKGGLMTVGDSDTTIEDAIQAQKDAVKAETKAREALDRDRPAVWSIEVYDTEHPLAPPLLEDKLEGYRTAVTYAYKVYRSGVDVTDIIAKSPTPLVKWSRRNPKGYDDDGLADREWEAAHASDAIVTLTTRQIHFECSVTATADSTSLEEYYKSL